MKLRILLLLVALVNADLPSRLVQISILAGPDATAPLADVVPPRMTLLVQRLDARYAITGIDYNNSHVLLVDDKEQLVQPMVDWAQLAPYALLQSPPLLCASLPQGNCTGFTMSTWTLWNTVFGLTQNDSPTGKRFRFHLPVILQRIAGVQSQAVELQDSSIIVVANQDATVTFVCDDCPGHHFRSQMSTTDGWILGGFLIFFFICIIASFAFIGYTDTTTNSSTPRRVVTTTREAFYA